MDASSTYFADYHAERVVLVKRVAVYSWVIRVLEQPKYNEENLSLFYVASLLFY